ncbi:MAG: YheU family protein [Cellvibrionales bacterium]|nr:YheU family protein [Cellvibrionales bacterium]
MIIPWQELEPQTLINLIEHFILREGTDYGETEISLSEKVEQIKAQLKNGEVLIVYSEETDSIDIQVKP